MLLLLLVYLGGLLSIFSPCVLPVLPFVFARSERSFMRSGLPVLIGMATTFTVLASFAAVGGAWLVKINQYGRYAALFLLLLLGLALIWPALSERLMRPFVTLGGRLQQQADKQGTIRGELLLGVAVGFLWAPCGGPILGLVLTGAALSGANWFSAILLLVFAAGAATSLALALFAGGKILSWMKRGLGADQWVRRILGIAVVAGVIVIAMGWDTRFLSRLSSLNTTGTEKKLIEKLTIQPPASIVVGTSVMPPLSGATLWLNSPPLRSEMLRGKVVLVDFWTYSCINCLRTLPYLEAWDRKYRDQGLLIIGVHSPEFAFEKDRKNVEQAVHDLGITYPVAMDNRFAIWNAFDNKAWPAHYLIDAKGRIRHRQSGEGAYDETERMIQDLLSEANLGRQVRGDTLVKPVGTGVTASASDIPSSPETYVGYGRQEDFASREPIRHDVAAQYSTPVALDVDQWALAGRWVVSEENALLQSAGGSITYRFQGRDLHLVLGSQGRKPVRFRITLDGAAPGADHGTDIDPQGNGVIRKQRLYQLIRQTGTIKPRTFRIEFLDAGAVAFAFTFG
jgi:cytochrome c biogenesis protein CcdA/thiol-disulfide isomerase/thioredoxin